VSLCWLWDRMVWVCGIECVLCVGQFEAGLGELVCAVFGSVWSGFGEVILFCVWLSLGRFCVSEFVLCVGEIGAGLGEKVCAVCGTVCCGFVGVSLCCVWYRLERVWR